MEDKLQNLWPTLLRYSTCTVKYHESSRHVLHECRRHECNAASDIYRTYASAHARTTIAMVTNFQERNGDVNYCSNASASESGLASLLPPEIYHCFFDDIEPVELPTSMLNLPVPPSLSVYTAPSSFASAEPLTSQAGALLDDSELQEFVEQQKNVNTKRKTQSDFRRWYSWCKCRRNARLR